MTKREIIQDSRVVYESPNGLEFDIKGQLTVTDGVHFKDGSGISSDATLPINSAVAVELLAPLSVSGSLGNPGDVLMSTVSGPPVWVAPSAGSVSRFICNSEGTLNLTLGTDVIELPVTLVLDSSSSDIIYDSYFNVIQILTAGIYRVDVSVRLIPVDSADNPVPWPSGTFMYGNNMNYHVFSDDAYNEKPKVKTKYTDGSVRPYSIDGTIISQHESYEVSFMLMASDSFTDQYVRVNMFAATPPSFSGNLYLQTRATIMVTKVSEVHLVDPV